MVCYGGADLLDLEPGQTVAAQVKFQDPPGFGGYHYQLHRSGSVPAGLPAGRRPSTVRIRRLAVVARPCGPGHAEPGDGAV
ncbi:MAG: hypothetical protein ACLTYN_05895 [Dysosmobacter welbionis]